MFNLINFIVLYERTLILNCLACTDMTQFGTETSLPLCYITFSFANSQ